MKKLTLLLAGALFALAFLPAAAMAGAIYEITITNLTKGQAFTPFILVTHRGQLSLFEVGDEASDELATIAESGNIAPMMDYLSPKAAVMDIQATDGLLMPGDSVKVDIEGDHIFNRLSVVSMLIPTNDSFIGVDSTKLSPWKLLEVPAYDAGSETNDEDCANIPGPVCGGAGPSPGDDGEGFIHVSGGIAGHGDLDPGAYDWRNPAAHVEIRRVRR
jgi:hypothetical protein